MRQMDGRQSKDRDRAETEQRQSGDRDAAETDKGETETELRQRWS